MAPSPRRCRAARAALGLASAVVLFPGAALGFLPPSARGTTAGTVPGAAIITSRLHAVKVATFGMGCFWAPAETMLETPGVLETVAGYTGHPEYAGDKPPKYGDVCYSRNWVEGVRVTYDDAVLSYPELLESFFEAQEPRYGSRQYGSMIFPSDEEQAREAAEWLERGTADGRVREKDGVPAGMTTIEPASTFYAAEGYHQKYWEKWRVRLGIGAGLLAVASGALGPILPPGDADLAQRVETVANGMFVAGGVFAILERLLDAKVVKMQ
eukprot:CAMPEP_0113583112 /NCGR_PEP_ID=MMETSP0015_2-20120614/32317_1 /TAXON_ID=2838 /ORGANISM="Odontella" /LENGTH=268 /DNA_ID=CAMNT_0000487915 /DNA_START=118 /DNA_END=924 /DNA_ORIENTATION=- /assembly_acc=CAM_ASM_000160